MPANVAWHSEIWPAMPVMTVIDRKITEKMTAVVKMLSPALVERRHGEHEHDPTDDHAEDAGREREEPAPRRRDASAGGGGSTPDSGSVLAAAVRSPGQKSSRRNSTANGSDGRRFCASTLAGGRYPASNACATPSRIPPSSASGMLVSRRERGRGDRGDEQRREVLRR